MAKQLPFSEDVFEQILDRHAAGATIRSICRLEGMPKARTFYEWLDNDPELQRRFKAARRSAVDEIADEIKEIADTPLMGQVEEIERVPKPRPPGVSKDTPLEYEEVVVKRTRKDMIEHRKLQVDSRFKLLAKWDSARYGDRVALEHGGGLGLNLVINEAPKPPDPEPA